MNAKDLQAGSGPLQRPRSPRVPVEFALEVEGSTPAGESFHVKAQAIKISRAGATIILDEEVVVRIRGQTNTSIWAKARGAGQWSLDGRNGQQPEDRC